MKPLLTLLLLVAFAVAGCGGDGGPAPEAAPTTQPPAAAGSCAMQLVYDGATYLGYGTTVAPEQGERLGTATVPGCSDTPGIEAPPAATIEVHALPGVAPRLAVVHDGSLYVRADADAGAFPPGLTRLLEPAG